MAIIAKLGSDGRGARKRAGPRRRRRLKSLAFVPTMVTLANLVCGFAAVHFSLRSLYEFGGGVSADAAETLSSPLLELMLPSFLSVAAGLIILGMVFDCFDGLLARVTRSTTDFGGQLDSLADVVTFGVAPATLMVAFMTQELAGESIVPSPLSAHFLGRFTWVSAAVYVAFTAIRLARFNVEHAKAEFDYRTFMGLPSPGAAAVMAAVIIFQDSTVGQPFRPVIVYAMPIIALLTAILMVSRVPYDRWHQTYLVGRRPVGQLIGFLLVLGAFWLYKAPTLLALVLWYGVSGPVFYLLKRWRRPSPSAVHGHTGSSDNSVSRSA